MSRETEKAMSQIHKYLEENGSEDMDIEEMNSLLQDFMQEYNGSLPGQITEENAKTSDDFLELAEKTDDKKSALKYAKKALLLDPDNLDAELMVADMTARDAIDLLEKLEHAVAHGSQVMEARGYTDEKSIGNYWNILETRPYMRLRDRYMATLKECGMIRRAVSECEEMMRLCENDNLGSRFILMHLYALLEEEEKALALHQKYDGHEESQMLFPLSVLYFKLGDLDRAGEYLDRLFAANKDTKKFIRAVVNDKLGRYCDEMADFVYRPFTIEELITELLENQELFKMTPAYFPWANERLKGKKVNRK